MLIRCWGSRGSIPVSGPEYLKYGGDTTCIELRTADDQILVIDAGSGIRRLGARLLEEGRTEMCLLFTHAHWDHLLGFPFFRPLYREDCHLKVMGCPCAQDSVREMISHCMQPPNFPVPLDKVHARLSFREQCREPFRVGSVTVSPIPISHPNRGLGYSFSEDGRTFVFLTDNELRFQHTGGGTFDDYVQACAAADLLIHDAEYAPDEYERFRTWGHSTFADAVDLAAKAGVKRLGLFHHNQDRTDAQIDAIERTCVTAEARQKDALDCFAVRGGMEIRV